MASRLLILVWLLAGCAASSSDTPPPPEPLCLEHGGEECLYQGVEPGCTIRFGGIPAGCVPRSMLDQYLAAQAPAELSCAERWDCRPSGVDGVEAWRCSCQGGLQLPVVCSADIGEAAAELDRFPEYGSPVSVLDIGACPRGQSAWALP